jgi:hypothetical protein
MKQSKALADIFNFYIYKDIQVDFLYNIFFKNKIKKCSNRRLIVICFSRSENPKNEVLYKRCTSRPSVAPKKYMQEEIIGKCENCDGDIIFLTDQDGSIVNRKCLCKEKVIKIDKHIDLMEQSRIQTCCPICDQRGEEFGTGKVGKKEFVFRFCNNCNRSFFDSCDIGSNDENNSSS